MNPFTEASELHEENGQLKLELEDLKEELRELGVRFEQLGVAVANATSALVDLGEVPLMYLEDSIEVIRVDLLTTLQSNG